MIEFNLLKMFLWTVLLSQWKTICDASAPDRRDVISPFAWHFFLTENYTNQSYGHLLATADCLPVRCQSAIMLNFTNFKGRPGKDAPVLCFLFDQHCPYSIDRWTEENVGCPYRSCRIHDAKTLKDNEIIIRGPYQGHNFYRTPTGMVGCLGSMGFYTSQGSDVLSRDTTWPSSYVYIWHCLVQIQTTLQQKSKNKKKS